MNDQHLILAKKMARRCLHGVDDLTDDAAWAVASPLLRENIIANVELAASHFAERDNEYVRLANRDLGRVYDHNQRLTLAMTELLNACHADFGVPDEGDGDDEPVGASTERPMALQFGMLRRAAAAAASTGGDLLWGVHLRGPDDIVPAESYAKALEVCDFWLAEDRKNAADPNMPMISAVPVLWTFGAAEHTADLAKGGGQ